MEKILKNNVCVYIWYVYIYTCVLYMCVYICMHAKSLHSCLILCNPMDCSPPGSSVHGILKARILEWISYRDLPNPGIKPGFLMSLLHWQADSLPLFFTTLSLFPLYMGSHLYIYIYKTTEINTTLLINYTSIQ